MSTFIVTMKSFFLFEEHAKNQKKKEQKKTAR